MGLCTQSRNDNNQPAHSRPAPNHCSTSKWCLLQVAKGISIPFDEVDAHNIIPPWVVSGQSVLICSQCSTRRGHTHEHDASAKQTPESAKHSLPCTDKKEVGARTIRRKVHQHLPDFLVDIPQVQKQEIAWTWKTPDENDWEAILKDVRSRGKDVPEVSWCKPGEQAGWEVGDARGAQLVLVLRLACSVHAD